MSTSQKNTASIEELYIKEKKKSALFIGSTLLLAVLLVGFVINSSNQAATDTVANSSTLAAGQTQARPGGRGGQSITGFFNDDGTVNQEAVDTFAARLGQGGGPEGADSSQFLDRFIQQIELAVESGEITQAQGDSLQDDLAKIDDSGN